MNRTWFTADHHFGHANIIKYCDRPYGSVEDMDEDLIYKWNLVVGKGDIVYYLGDFTLKNANHAIEYMNRLNGFILFMRGNHDKWLTNDFVWGRNEYIESPYILKGKEGTFVLSHYAMREWPDSHTGSYLLYGHSHGKLPPFPNAVDVGIDCWSYFPISLKQIIAQIEINNGSN